MIEYVYEYIPWILVGILFVLVLSLLVSRFFRRKSVQHSREAHPYQGNAKTTLDPPVDSHSRTPENTVDDLNHHSSDLKPLLQTLIDETQGIQKSLNQITEILQSQVVSEYQDISSLFQEEEKVLTPYQDMKEPPQLSESKTNEQTPPVPPQSIQREPTEWMPPVLSEFCDLYNAGKQDELQTRYQRLYRISVVNAIERRQSLSEHPLFENSTNGKFLVYHIESEDLYAVVPFYGLVLQDSLYSSGAFSEVFDCPGFDSQHRYYVKVIRPAFFKQDNEKWTLQEKGELELKEKDN